jgi:hypothetical protein
MSTSPSSTPDPRQAELAAEMQRALDTYDAQRATLLERAFEQGGADAVSKLEDEHQALRDALFELIKRQLVANSAQFPNLIADTLAATKAITTSINGLAATANVLGNITKAINLVGRLVVLFGA